MARFSLVLTAVPKTKTAHALARAIVDKRLAACVSVSGSATSYYIWHGHLEKTREFLLLIKTKTGKINSLMKFIKKTHPYDVPEIIALPISSGWPRYLSWLEQNVR
ncbi:MAG: divalent-cation tolerance protein CutA [Elusimicrobiota bacterium]